MRLVRRAQLLTVAGTMALVAPLSIGSVAADVVSSGAAGDAREAVQAAQAAGQRAGAPPQTPAPGGAPARGGGGRGRGAVQVMTLTVPWPAGGEIPVKYTQAGDELSPALAWDNVPDTASSFVLLVHDVSAAAGTGTDDVLHWMVWNIPGAWRSLPEGVPQGSPLPDGVRQLSVSGPYYRGPGAPASGPAHHYLFELFAIEGDVTSPPVPPQGTSVAQARQAIVESMAGRIRGKAVAAGWWKRR
jgi:hypothetical protein